ncbi:hypothetical protein PAPYR_1550 [Paratrimastix pyriformis]|uniref:Uncharacterized protein n=1 Tax=Paratrimastix pyriformis TaxID=342808 RepID=A0ABQ8UWY4_9EUKA|nr:hypothetical protein PAPYR_1550 [Paratrimastix pyriformis]
MSRQPHPPFIHLLSYRQHLPGARLRLVLDCTDIPMLAQMEPRAPEEPATMRVVPPEEGPPAPPRFEFRNCRPYCKRFVLSGDIRCLLVPSSIACPMKHAPHARKVPVE